jgi:hypothetical protein
MIQNSGVLFVGYIEFEIDHIRCCPENEFCPIVVAIDIFFDIFIDRCFAVPQGVQEIIDTCVPPFDHGIPTGVDVFPQESTDFFHILYSFDSVGVRSLE